MEEEVRSSSLLVAVYQWAPKNSVPFAYSRKFAAMMQIVDHVKPKTYPSKKGVWGKIKTFCSPTHGIRYQSLAHAFHLLSILFLETA